MTCARFVEIASLHAVPAADAEAFAAHGESCSECAQAYRAICAMRETRVEPDPQDLAGFAARVRARAVREELARHLSPARAAVAAAALAVAASVALMIALDRIAPRPWQPGPSAQTAQTAQADDLFPLATPEDPLANLSDDELVSLEELIDEGDGVDEEAGT